MTTRIRIGELNNRCRFLGSQDNVAFLASELRQLSEAVLPAAIGEEVDRRLHTLLQDDGVYRIRRLHLDLALTRRDLSTRQLGALLAERLVESLRVRLQQPGHGDVAYFPSQTDFVAQMMADLLLQETANLWMYEDYAALRHLSPTEAVVQLLLPRADQVGALMTGIAQRNALAVLLQALRDEQAGRLLRQWTGQAIAAQFRAGVVPACRDLVQLQSWLAATPSSALDNSAPLALATVRHLLLCLANAECQVSLETALWAVAHRVFAQRYRRFVASTLIDAASPSLSAESLSPLSSAPADVEAPAVLEDMRRWMAESPEHRDYVMRMLRQLRMQEVEAVATPARARAPETTAPRDKLLFSRRAGLVLLVPIIVSLRLHTCYTMAELRGALWAAAGARPEESPEQGANAGVEEAWLRELLPDAPQALPSGALPPAWRLGLRSERQSEIERLQQAGAVQQMLAQLLLAHFAARLSGLQLSSDAYLRNQFLHCSGYFIIDEMQIIARLDSIPLFVVLRMAGLSNWSDQLPWLQRLLIIDIAAG